jgi:hypothetical protein
LEVEVEPLHDFGERRSGTVNRDRLPTCARLFISNRGQQYYFIDYPASEGILKAAADTRRAEAI